VRESIKQIVKVTSDAGRQTLGVISVNVMWEREMTKEKNYYFFLTVKRQFRVRKIGAVLILIAREGQNLGFG
jgi:hypothetical protein